MSATTRIPLLSARNTSLGLPGNRLATRSRLSELGSWPGLARPEIVGAHTDREQKDMQSVTARATPMSLPQRLSEERSCLRFSSRIHATFIKEAAASDLDFSMPRRARLYAKGTMGTGSRTIRMSSEALLVPGCKLFTFPRMIAADPGSWSLRR